MLHPAVDKSASTGPNDNTSVGDFPLERLDTCRDSNHLQSIKNEQQQFVSPRGSPTCYTQHVQYPLPSHHQTGLITEIEPSVNHSSNNYHQQYPNTQFLHHQQHNSQQSRHGNQNIIRLPRHIQQHITQQIPNSNHHFAHMIPQSHSQINQASPLSNQSNISNISPCVPGMPHLTTFFWEDKGTSVYQLDTDRISICRRMDNHFVNGTKLLNVTEMTRGKRDSILKNEKDRDVIKSGPMRLKGVWIPLDRAIGLAEHHAIARLVYPLLESDPAPFVTGPHMPTAYNSVSDMTLNPSHQLHNDHNNAVALSQTAPINQIRSIATQQYPQFIQPTIQHSPHGHTQVSSHNGQPPMMQHVMQTLPTPSHTPTPTPPGNLATPIHSPYMINQNQNAIIHAHMQSIAQSPYSHNVDQPNYLRAHSNMIPQRRHTSKISANSPIGLSIPSSQGSPYLSNNHANGQPGFVNTQIMACTSGIATPSTSVHDVRDQPWDCWNNSNELNHNHMNGLIQPPFGSAHPFGSSGLSHPSTHPGSADESGFVNDNAPSGLAPNVNNAPPYLDSYGQSRSGSPGLPLSTSGPSGPNCLSRQCSPAVGNIRNHD